MQGASDYCTALEENADMNWSHVRTSVDALYNLLFYVEVVVDWHRNAVDFEYPPSHLQVSQRRSWPERRRIWRSRGIHLDTAKF